MKRIVVVLPALITLICSLAFWRGMRASDDLDYAQVAMSHLDPAHSPPLFNRPDFHNGRLGTIGPLALIFALFGPSSLALAILPLISTVLTASMVAWLAWRFWGNACGLTAGLLYASLPLTIGEATFYVPEPMATLEICVAIALVVIALDREKRAGLLRFIAGATIGIAYLTTEVSALILPALFVYLWLAGKGSRRDVWLIAGFALIFGAELIYHAAVNGNALHRFALTQGYGDDPLVRATNSGGLAYRLFKAYPALFIYPNLDFGVTGGLMVIGGLFGLIRWRETSLFVIWAAVILLFYNFMSGSLKEYIAIPVAARHVAPALVPLLILFAKLLVTIWDWAGRAIRSLLIAGGVGLATASLIVMYLNTAPTFAEAVSQNSELVARFLRPEPSVVMVTDQRSARAIQFYRGYNPKDKFFTYELAAGARDQGPVFVVHNGPMLNQEQVDGSDALNKANRAGFEQLPVPPGTQVFAGRYEGSPLVSRLLRYRPVRLVLGPYYTRLDEWLLSPDSTDTQVRVFRNER